MVVRLPIPLNQGPVVARAIGRPENTRPACLPVENPTKSFWTDSSINCNPLAAEGSNGDLTRTADICIIGSGMTGVSTAYHLSNLIKDGNKPRIVIVEARDFCAHLVAHCKGRKG